ncbi:PucR family transcriptional regulator [Rhodococcus opacus]|nr:helix-turn-helix domain-containing protein [Rhodococcus opacus]
MVDRMALEGVTHSLRSRIGELTDLVRRRLRSDVPEFTADVDPALAVSETERIAAALRSIIDGLEGAAEPSSAPLDEATAEARAVAQAGIDLNLLIRTYRVAQAAMLDVLLSETTDLIDDPEIQLAIQQQISRFQFDWNDAVLEAVIRAYQDAQYSFFFHSRDRQLRTSLRELIAGRTDNPPPIDYPFAQNHLAAVVWGDRRDHLVDQVAEILGSAKRVHLAGTSGTVLVWYSLRNPDEDVHRLKAELDRHEGAFYAFGNPGRGIAGFRTSHQQAWRAYRVGRWSSTPVTWYADIALESLFMKDIQAARDFVTQQLGALDPADPRTDVLFETLRAYFAAGCNAVRAAGELAVHERTVSYRLRSVEDQLGISVLDKRDELVVALRLHAALRAITAANALTDLPRSP